MKKYFAASLLIMFFAALTFPQTNAVLFRDDDEFAGPVHNIRTEVVGVSVQNGEHVEGPRVLVQTRNYSSDGRQCETTFYAPDRSVSKKEVRIYNESGKWVEWNSYDASGSLVFRKLNIFDEGGRIIVEMTLNGDGTVQQRKVIVWSPMKDRMDAIDTYNGEGTLIRKDVSQYDNQNEKLIWVTVEPGGKHSKQTFDLTNDDPRRRIQESVGADSQGVVASTFTDSDTGQQIDNTIYNATGSVVQKLPVNREYDSRKNVIKETHLRAEKDDETPEPLFVLYNTISYY